MKVNKNRSVVLCLALLGVLATVGISQDIAADKARGRALMEATKYTEALPLYENLAKQAPKDPEVQLNLGFALLGQAWNTDDAAKRKELRVRARAAFIAARDNGNNSPMVLGMIDGLPADGSPAASFSDNAAANKMMEKGEALFTQGKIDEAFKAYQEALTLDPRAYHAALFSGDMMMQTGKFDEAEKWYQRAIKIDPYIETAYRYSATPLMKQGKHQEARDRYIEAYITEPYGRMAVSGLSQWGQVTKTSLGHPRIDTPESKTGADGKQNTTINISPDDDGSIAWIAYSATRENWRSEKFAKSFPKGTPYRHSLAEEVDALRSVVTMARSTKAKTLNPQIAMIERLDKDGLLEAYVLLAKPDQGIAQDHRQYLKADRDKLRQYVQKYVIGAGG